MRRTIALLLSLLLLLTAGCGSGNRAAGAEENSGETAGEVTETGDQAEETVPAPEEEPEPEPAPEPEPYAIYDPTVMPEGGQRDGVTYEAYDGIVEHLFFHPVIAYPELAFDGDAQEKEIGRAHV